MVEADSRYGIKRCVNVIKSEEVEVTCSLPARQKLVHKEEAKMLGGDGRKHRCSQAELGTGVRECPRVCKISVADEDLQT